MAWYVVLKHAKGNIKMSHSHLIYVNGVWKLAGDVIPGDELLWQGLAVQVTEVDTELCQGVFSLLTESGHISINEVKVSCYCALELSGPIGARIMPALRGMLASHNFH